MTYLSTHILARYVYDLRSVNQPPPLVAHRPPLSYSGVPSFILLRLPKRAHISRATKTQYAKTSTYIYTHINTHTQDIRDRSQPATPSLPASSSEVCRPP